MGFVVRVTERVVGWCGREGGGGSAKVEAGGGRRGRLKEGQSWV